MKNRKLLIILFTLLILCGCENNTKPNDTEKDPSTPPINDKIKFNMSTKIKAINHINQTLISNNYDYEDFITEEDGTNFYRYTGDDTDKIISELNEVYMTGANGAFFRTRRNEESQDLFVHKPEHCEQIIEISVNDIEYDEDLNEKDYSSLIIDDGDYFYSTKIVRDADGKLRISSPIDPCIYGKIE